MSRRKGRYGGRESITGTPSRGASVCSPVALCRGRSSDCVSSVNPAASFWHFGKSLFFVRVRRPPKQGSRRGLTHQPRAATGHGSNAHRGGVRAVPRPTRKRSSETRAAGWISAHARPQHPRMGRPSARSLLMGLFSRTGENAPPHSSRGVGDSSFQNTAPSLPVRTLQEALPSDPGRLRCLPRLSGREEVCLVLPCTPFDSGHVCAKPGVFPLGKAYRGQNPGVYYERS